MNGFTPFHADVTAGLLALVGNPKKAEETLKGIYKEQEILEKKLVEDNKVLADTIKEKEAIQRMRLSIDTDQEKIKIDRNTLAAQKQANLRSRDELNQKSEDLKKREDSLAASYKEFERQVTAHSQRETAIRKEEARIEQLKVDTEAVLADAHALKASFEEKLAQFRQIAK